MKYTELISTLEFIEAAIEEDEDGELSVNPLLLKVRFILTDDKPNMNGQGIEYEDFPRLMKTAINAPIKMRYMGEAGAGGHPLATTIGHITDLEEQETEDGTHRVIANGIVYAGEYPKEADYLKESLAKGEAPGISWELSYKKEKKVGPIEWLKGIITRAATFVRHPAYGTRTALLALASDQNLSDEQLNEQILTLAQELSPKNDNEGGSNTVEEDVKKLQEELDAKIAEIAALTTAKAELEAKVTAQDEVISAFQRKQLIAERTAKVVEAGLKLDTDAEKLAKKQEFWANLSEDAFAEYIEDLTAASKTTVAERKTAVAATDGPRPDATASTGETVDISDMVKKFRAMNRNGKTE